MRSFDELVAAGNAFGDVREMPSYVKAIELWNSMNDDREPFSFTL
ncbi:MAG: hypothetical protein ACFCUR_04735 [Rhodomicrobiaceae bacterium]